LSNIVFVDLFDAKSTRTLFIVTAAAVVFMVIGFRTEKWFNYAELQLFGQLGILLL
jgi:hypothetical protein